MMINLSARTTIRTLGQRKVCLQQRVVVKKEFGSVKRMLSTSMVLRIGELNSTDSLLSHLQEPSLASLGLAGNTPPGFFQAVLEHVHLGCELPWWGTIVASMSHSLNDFVERYINPFLF